MPSSHHISVVIESDGSGWLKPLFPASYSLPRCSHKVEGCASPRPSLPPCLTFCLFACFTLNTPKHPAATNDNIIIIRIIRIMIIMIITITITIIIIIIIVNTIMIIIIITITIIMITHFQSED